MTEALMRYETIDTKQIDQIMDGKIPDPPSDWDDSGSDGGQKTKTDSSADSESKPEDKPSIGDTAEQH